VSNIHPWILDVVKAHCEKAKGWRIPPAFALCAHSPSVGCVQDYDAIVVCYQNRSIA